MKLPRETFPLRRDTEHKGLASVVLATYLLFIYQKSRGAGYGFYEVSFQKRNFMHLAGIRSRTMKAERFYEACLNGELTVED